MRLEQPSVNLYFARHGQTEMNAKDLLISRTDLPLNAIGKQQAHLLKEKLRPIMFKDIYSSPLLRAQETASAVSEERNIPLHIRPQLIERDFGNLEGHYYHHSKNDRKNFLSHQPKSAKSRNNIHHIESDQQIKERLIPLLKTIAIAHLGYKGQREVNDLFVTHSGIMRFLLRYFGHIRYEEMNGLIIHETAYIKVQFKNNRFSILDMDGVEGPPHLLNSLLNRPVVTS